MCQYSVGRGEKCHNDTNCFVSFASNAERSERCEAAEAKAKTQAHPEGEERQAKANCFAFVAPHGAASMPQASQTPEKALGESPMSPMIGTDDVLANASFGIISST